MKYPTVSALCEGVAEAIKAKEGSSAKINPQDFVERIEALQIGGGGESGTTIEYLDVSGVGEGKNLICGSAILTKSDGLIMPPMLAFASGNDIDYAKIDACTAIAVDLSIPINLYGEMSLQEMLGADMWTAIPRLTKEQFYSLE